MEKMGEKFAGKALGGVQVLLDAKKFLDDSNVQGLLNSPAAEAFKQHIAETLLTEEMAKQQTRGTNLGPSFAQDLIERYDEWKNTMNNYGYYLYLDQKLGLPPGSSLLKPGGGTISNQDDYSIPTTKQLDAGNDGDSSSDQLPTVLNTVSPASPTDKQQEVNTPNTLDKAKVDNQVNGANAAKLTDGYKVPQAIKDAATNALSKLAAKTAGGIGGPGAAVGADAAVQAATTANLGK